MPAHCPYMAFHNLFISVLFPVMTGVRSDCLVKAPQFPGSGLGLDFLWTWKAGDHLS